MSRPSDPDRRRRAAQSGLASAARRASLAIGCLAILAGCQGRSADGVPPNIVLILLDDLATSDLQYLPKLAALTADRGMTLRMIVPSPKCGPSRASILTGQYAHNHRVLGNGPGPGGWAHLRPLEPSLVNCWVQGAGYQTHYTGKYITGYGHHDRTHVPPCWNDWQALTTQSSEQRDRFSINANGKVERYDGRYLTDVLSEKLTAFIAQTTVPFFAIFAPPVPHVPVAPAAKYAGTLKDLELSRPPSFDEPDTSDKSHGRGRLSEAEVARIDARIRGRLEMLRSIEDTLEAVLAALKKRGIEDRTYVFLTSDNGYFNGEHRYPLGKSLPYREATEVPLLVSGPGIAAGSRSDELVLNHDLATTFGDLAGAAIPADVDGRSVVPILHGGDRRSRQRVLLEHFNRRKELAWSGVRTRQGVRIKWADGPWESYDYATDPNELAGGDAEDPSLAALATCKGESCGRLEDAAP